VSAGNGGAQGSLPETDAPKLRIDLHCHTEASHDCVTPLAQIPAQLIARGTQVQAITDHDEIWGAQKLQQMVAESEEWRAKLTIIVGEEISTKEGEIIGLFLKEKVPPGLTPEDTVKAIREQGGLVDLPHGFDPLKRHRLRPTARERIAEQIDIIEVFNARISNVKWNEAARQWAAGHNKLMATGSDAHTWADLGCCCGLSAWQGQVLMPDDLRLALAHIEVNGKWTHPAWAFLQKSAYWLKEKLGGKH
jgi:predicted metal-dependent phosphoesterase TrpH